MPELGWLLQFVAVALLLTVKSSIPAQLKPPFFVRAGLSVIRTLVRAKATLVAFASLVFGAFAPVGRFFVSVVVLPAYSLLYGFQRRFGRVYRPAKNRLMFFLTNRYTVHAVVIGLVLVTGVVNFRLGEVRAESDVFGQQSLLYGIVTKQEVEVIEEYADPLAMTESVTVSSFGDGALHVAPGGATALAVEGTDGLGQRGIALTSPPSDNTSQASAAPRSAVITYEVQTGDTLSTISEQFDISLNTLLWANGLTVRSVIKPGMELAILPVSGVQHTIRSGDTLSAIAKKYSVGTDAIVAFNGSGATDTLKIGQQLIVPGGELTAPAPTTRTVAVKNIFTTAPAGSGGATTPTGGAKMVWPTDLRYIVRGLSWFHSGTDIDCNGRADGTSTNDNYAAADGIVQFSGAKRGYGYTVEINHGNGLVTRYGHFHSLYVKAGESVSAGTPLGRCGSTGNSTGTHLHFEVIANGVFKNPASYLGY